MGGGVPEASVPADLEAGVLEDGSGLRGGGGALVTSVPPAAHPPTVRGLWRHGGAALTG